MDRTQFRFFLLAVVIIGLILAFNLTVHTKIEAVQDRVFAESSVDQKLDALYQQNKEIRQAIEECKVWILVK